MKNIPELSCAIVEDLLPTYVERLTSEETNMAVEAHLASCPACAAKRTAMGAKETEAAGQNAEETAREVDYLKKVKRRGWKRAALAVLCTAAVLAAVNLADQLTKAQEGAENLRRQLKTYLDEASRAKNEAAELRRKLQNAQNQNNRR